MPIAIPSKRSQSYTRQSSRSSTASSTGSGSLAASGSVAGSSSFLVGRQRERLAEMELFSHGRKPRSNYRRPSSLGLSVSAQNAKSESTMEYTPLPASRSHIVSPIADHLRPEGNFEALTEVKASYRNLSPARPVIHRLKDTLKPEGDFAKGTETSVAYNDKQAQRPVIHRLYDHGSQVIPEGKLSSSSEYRGNFSTAPKGERVMPVWISNFEKVTIGGKDGNRA